MFGFHPFAGVPSSPDEEYHDKINKNKKNISRPIYVMSSSPPVPPASLSTLYANIGWSAAEQDAALQSFYADQVVRCEAEQTQLETTQATLTVELEHAAARLPNVASPEFACGAGLRGAIEVLHQKIAFYAAKEKACVDAAEPIISCIAALADVLGDEPSESFVAAIDPVKPRQAWTERMEVLSAMEVKMKGAEKIRTEGRDRMVTSLRVLIQELDMLKDEANGAVVLTGAAAIADIDRMVLNTEAEIPLFEMHISNLKEREETLTTLKVERASQIKQLIEPIATLFTLCETPVAEQDKFKKATMDSHSLSNIAILTSKLEALRALKAEKMHSLCADQSATITTLVEEMTLSADEVAASCPCVATWEANPTDAALDALTAYAAQLETRIVELRPILEARKKVFGCIEKGREYVTGAAKIRIDAKGLKPREATKQLNAIQAAGDEKNIKKVKGQLFTLAKAWKKNEANPPLTFDGVALGAEITTAVKEFNAWRKNFYKEAAAKRKADKVAAREAELQPKPRKRRKGQPLKPVNK